MKISELIVLLEQRKEQYGDIRVATYLDGYDRVKEFTEVAVFWDDEEESNSYLELL